MKRQVIECNKEAADEVLNDGVYCAHCKPRGWRVLATVFKFDTAELDTGRYEVRRQGRAIKLEKIPMELLLLLVSKQGELVTREEIIARLWGNDVFVDTEQGINTAIRKIRMALRDDPERPRFVQTVVGKGYRFVAPVVVPEEGAEAVSGPAIPVGRLRRWWIGAVAIAALLAMWVGVRPSGWRERLLGRGKPPIRSLAVLPLENLSGNPAEDYFADGMTDALITDLAKVSTLKVISRTSVMRYKATRKPLPEIARELNVDAVLEGAVVRSGDRVRITAQLIYAPTDRHLWAESYESELGDVLSLQNEVARAITKGIRLELTPQEQQRLAATRSVNFDAYQDYLQGRYFWNKRDPASIKKAIDYFEQAIQKDSNYALPYAGLGDSYQFLPGLPGEEAFAKSTAAYAKAIERDSSLAEAHAGLGLLLATFSYQWANAEQEFRRAIELNPGYASAHQWYSNVLASLGRKEEAKAETLKALQLDPLSPIINTTLGYRLAEDERYDDAIAQFRKVLEINPNFWTAHYALGEAYLEKGIFKEGIAEDRTAQILRGYEPDKVNRDAEALSEAYERAGPRGYWQKRLELAMAGFKVQRRAKPGEVTRYEIAGCHARLGQRDQALHWLNESYAVREGELGETKTNPAFKDLRSDPRFQDLLHSIGLSP